VPLASIEPEVLTKTEAQPKIKTVLGGTPQNGKRMANVLKPLKVVLTVISKITTILLSTHVARSLTSELKVPSSLKTSLDTGEGSTLKVYSITDTIREKEQEKTKALEDECFTERKAKEAPSKQHEYIIRHTSRGKLTAEQIVEVQYYVEYLKYPSSSIVYGSNDEDDYLYCLLDSRELEVCHEMMDKMGFPKLECGLSAMPKD
jgi:hypothetical protein